MLVYTSLTLERDLEIRERGVKEILRGEGGSGEGSHSSGKETQMKDIDYSLGIGAYTALDNSPFPYVSSLR